MADAISTTPTDGNSPIFPYPMWENGPRFEIFSAIENPDGSATSLPWPSELIRRVQNFTFEDSEHVSRVHIKLINSDFQLTEVQLGDIPIQQQKEGASNYDPKQAPVRTIQTVRKRTNEDGQKNSDGNRNQVPREFSIQKDTVVFKDYFELGVVIGVRFGYGGERNQFMSPFRVMRILRINGLNEILIEAYETYYSLSNAIRTVNWYIGSKAIKEVLLKSQTEITGDLQKALEPAKQTIQTVPSAQAISTFPDPIEFVKSQLANKAVPAIDKDKPVTNSSTQTDPGLTTGIYLGDLYVPVNSNPAEGEKIDFYDGFEGRPLKYALDADGLPHIGVVSTIARKYGFRAKVEERYIFVKDKDGNPTDQKKELKFTYLQTASNDLQFLQVIANYLGFTLWIDLDADYWERLVHGGDPNYPGIFPLSDLSHPIGTFFFQPRMYWQPPYAKYSYGLELGPEDKYRVHATCFDSILSFDEPEVDSRAKAGSFEGFDINPLTGQKYSGKNLEQQGFQFKQLGSNFYDYQTIAQGFIQKRFNLASQDSSGKWFREEFVRGLRGRTLTKEQVGALKEKFPTLASTELFSQQNLTLAGQNIANVAISSATDEKEAWDAKKTTPETQETITRRERAERRALARAFELADAGLSDDEITQKGVIEQQISQLTDRQNLLKQGSLTDATAKAIADISTQLIALNQALAALNLKSKSKEFNDTDKQVISFLENLLSLQKTAIKKGITGSQITNVSIPTGDQYELVQRFTGMFQQDLEDSIKGKMRVPGDPFLRAKRVIEVAGVGMYSAKYYVKLVKHQLDTAGYVSDVDIITNATAFAKENSKEALEVNVNKEGVDPIKLRYQIQDLLDRNDLIKRTQQAIEEKDKKEKAKAAEPIKPVEKKATEKEALYYIAEPLEDLRFQVGGSGALDENKSVGADSVQGAINLFINKNNLNFTFDGSDSTQPNKKFSLLTHVDGGYDSHNHLGIPTLSDLLLYPGFYRMREMDLFVKNHCLRVNGKQFPSDIEVAVDPSLAARTGIQYDTKLITSNIIADLTQIFNKVKSIFSILKSVLNTNSLKAVAKGAGGTFYFYETNGVGEHTGSNQKDFKSEPTSTKDATVHAQRAISFIYYILRNDFVNHLHRSSDLAGLSLQSGLLGSTVQTKNNPGVLTQLLQLENMQESLAIKGSNVQSDAVTKFVNNFASENGFQDKLASSNKADDRKTEDFRVRKIGEFLNSVVVPLVGQHTYTQIGKWTAGEAEKIVEPPTPQPERVPNPQPPENPIPKGRVPTLTASNDITNSTSPTIGGPIVAENFEKVSVNKFDNGKFAVIVYQGAGVTASPTVNGFNIDRNYSATDADGDQLVRVVRQFDTLQEALDSGKAAAKSGKAFYNNSNTAVAAVTPKG